MSVSLCRGPTWEPEERLCLQGTVRDSGRRATEMENLSLKELCQGYLEAYKKALEMGTSFHGGLTGKPGRGVICWGWGAYVWKKVPGWVSLHIGAPTGNLGRWACLPGTLKISWRVLAMELLSLWKFC